MAGRPLKFSKKDQGLFAFAVATSALPSLLTSPLLVSFVTFLASSGVSIYLAYHHEGRALKRAGFALTMTLIFAASCYWNYRQQRADTLTPDALVTFHTSTRYNDMFLQASLSIKVAHPINVLMLLEIKNISPYPIRLSRCSGWVRSHGKWHEMVRISTVSNFFISAPDQRIGTVFQFVDPTFDSLSQTQIEARRNVRGWVEFEYPPDTLDSYDQVRIRVEDDYKNHGELTIPFVDKDASSRLGGGDFKPLPVKVDLNDFDIWFFRDPKVTAS
jgi:hypothetical protein